MLVDGAFHFEEESKEAPSARVEQKKMSNAQKKKQKKKNQEIKN